MSEQLLQLMLRRLNGMEVILTDYSQSKMDNARCALSPRFDAGQKPKPGKPIGAAPGGRAHWDTILLKEHTDEEGGVKASRKQF